MAKMPDTVTVTTVHVNVEGTAMAVANVLAAADDLERRAGNLEASPNNGSAYSTMRHGRAQGYREAAESIRKAVQEAMPKTKKYAHCTGTHRSPVAGGTDDPCVMGWVVSQDDPDATMGDILQHAARYHPMENPAKILHEGPRPS